MATSVMTYADVRTAIGSGRCHLLLGNGFSIACDPVFRYGTLYEAALAAGLSDRAQQVFDRLGTNNFEGVMRLLDDSHWVAHTYDLVAEQSSAMLKDVDIVKQALVRAIATSHLAHTGEVPNPKKLAAFNFIQEYHNVFCTNYDLLLYWVNLSGDRAPLEDGFRTPEEDPDAPYVVFAERLGAARGIFYLHGAIHLYVAGGELRKHSWAKSGIPLMESVREGLSQGNYPLFVAEGKPEKKLEQIHRNGYLWYCLDKFNRIEKSLVVFGHSFGTSDQHILDTISDSPKLTDVYVGLFGNPESPPNQATMRAAADMVNRRLQLTRRSTRFKPLKISFYDSASANCWGN